MQYLAVILVLLSTLVTARTSAQSECADTFPARLAAAKTEVIEWFKADAAYRKYLRSPEGKALTFFNEHCRLLSPLEIAIRKLDDPLSFVCDPSAGPKPKALTTRLLVKNGGNMLNIDVDLSEHHTDTDNAECSTEDPIDLSVSNDFEDKENSAKTYLVHCYEDPRKGCQDLVDNARKMLVIIAKLKAAGKL